MQHRVIFFLNTPGSATVAPQLLRTSGIIGAGLITYYLSTSIIDECADKDNKYSYNLTAAALIGIYTAYKIVRINPILVTKTTFGASLVAASALAGYFANMYIDQSFKDVDIKSLAKKANFLTWGLVSTIPLMHAFGLPLFNKQYLKAFVAPYSIYVHTPTFIRAPMDLYLGYSIGSSIDSLLGNSITDLIDMLSFENKPISKESFNIGMGLLFAQAFAWSSSKALLDNLSMLPYMAYHYMPKEVSFAFANVAAFSLASTAINEVILRNKLLENEENASLCSKITAGLGLVAFNWPKIQNISLSGIFNQFGKLAADHGNFISAAVHSSFFSMIAGHYVLPYAYNNGFSIPIPFVNTGIECIEGLQKKRNRIYGMQIELKLIHYLESKTLEDHDEIMKLYKKYLKGSTDLYHASDPGNFDLYDQSQQKIYQKLMGLRKTADQLPTPKKWHSDDLEKAYYKLGNDLTYDLSYLSSVLSIITFIAPASYMPFCLVSSTCLYYSASHFDNKIRVDATSKISEFREKISKATTSKSH